MDLGTTDCARFGRRGTGNTKDRAVLKAVEFGLLGGVLHDDLN